MWVSIISSRRAYGVARMREMCPVGTWYVRDYADQYDYQQHDIPVIAAGTLVEARNQALADAFAQNLWCVQLSDDLRYVYKGLGNRVFVRSTVFEALAEIHKAMQQMDTYLGGAAPNSHRMNFKESHPISSTAFIVGDFMLVRPCALRFDPNLRLKEDYDYTMQHLTQFGKVSRCNSILPEFEHRSNKGGAVDYRDANLEQSSITYLRTKWPNQFRTHQTRANEIVLAYKPQ